MNGLDKCRRLYLKLSMKLESFTGDKESDLAFLRSAIRKELSSLEMEQKFRHGIFDYILDEGFIKHRTDWDYRLVAKAFEALEVYCRLLRTYPWKTEYHTLKTYGGFFRTYVYSVLPSCLDILQIIGYTPMPAPRAEYQVKPNVLQLNSLPNIALLETIGFDCLAASVECEMRIDTAIDTFTYLQLDDKKTREVMSNKLKKCSKLSMLTDKSIRKVISLPKELEPFSTTIGRLQANQRCSIAKTRLYHSEKLHLHEHRRNMFIKLDGLNNHNMVENVDFTTLNKNSTNWE